MLVITLPKIFFNIWFWFAIMAVIIIIHYFWGKAPPPPKPSKFFAEHKKAINKIMDVCIICIVSSLLLVFPIIQIFDALSAPEPTRTISVQTSWMILFTLLIVWSGASGSIVGFLSVFQSNLTKTKRVILLGICLLPIVLSVLLLMIETPLGLWSTIKFGLGYSFGCWLINGPAILIGKHFLPVSWNIMRKLRLVSGDYPG